MYMNGQFPKNHIPWNKGLKGWNKKYKNAGFQKGHSSYTSHRKGKTLEEIYGKETAEIIKEKTSKTWFKKGQKPVAGFMKGLIPWNKGLGNGIKAKRRREMCYPRYMEWRKAVFTRDDYTCVDCGKRGGRLTADHIKMWSIFPELRYEVSNGQTLCEKCAKEKTRKDLSKYWKNKFAMSKALQVLTNKTYV